MNISKVIIFFLITLFLASCEKDILEDMDMNIEEEPEMLLDTEKPVPKCLNKC